MDFSHFAPIPVVDGHIHFPHPELAEDLVTVMERTGLARANLVAVPDLQTINQNPALIHFKAHHPGRAYVCGALDYAQMWADPVRAPEVLAAQIATLKAIGFDGLKLVEGKPTVRRLLAMPFDGPQYAGMWAALEEQRFPVVFHVADPEEFWDAERCPDWARAQGWFYGDGTHPLKEHPDLKIIFAHFHFLSADLGRAGAFFDAHPHVCFDLTPGVEMYVNFARDLEAARDFFIDYQDRLVYGTDIGATAIQRDPSQRLDWDDSLGRAWIVRRFRPGGDRPRPGDGLGGVLRHRPAARRTGEDLPRQLRAVVWRRARTPGS
jgi:predicted TIM-barrel fold metal-dependent hydrolase